MSKTKQDPYRPADDGLYFLPLGGVGEIGMNMGLYGTAGKWLMVDCGVSFGDDSMPGIEVLTADPEFIVDRRDDLVAMIITHGHEDHLGAVEYLWPALQVPIYATPFTAALLRAKLAEKELGTRVRIIEVPLGGEIKIGPFTVRFINMAHSIPESSALAIKTKHGTALHTGDWKIDQAPVEGNITDEAALRALGDAGVDVLLGDSTNAMVPGRAGSESSLIDSFTKLFARIPQRIVLTCFASNVARLSCIAKAAAANDRQVALIGRSLWRIYDVALDTGYMQGLPPFVSEDEAGFLPRHKVVYIVTGSQGEPRSALARIANNAHPEIKLERDDTVIFSSREIPGNEQAIGRVQNALVKAGIQLITDDEEKVHVSGHPCRDELAELYSWVRPKLAVPVHGEARHLYEHARLAEACQVPATFVTENGFMTRLFPGEVEVVAQVHCGKLALDGTRLVPFNGSNIKGRQKISHTGVAVMSLTMNAKGWLVSEPQLTVIGVLDEESTQEESKRAIGAAKNAINQLPKAARIEDEAVIKAVQQAVRRSLHDFGGKKPVTTIHLTRIED